MGRAAFSQVDLDGGVLPAPLALYGDEVNGEAPQRPSLFQHLRHALSCLLDVPAVLGVGGEGAAQEDLTRGPAEHLVVGRDGRHLTEGVYATLHRRGAHLRALDKALDDAAHLRKLVAVAPPDLVARLEAYSSRQLVPDPLCKLPPLRSIFAREDRVALPREALVQLDYHASH